MSTTTLKIKVKPNARESSLVQLEDGSWKASVKASPVDGKANAELIGLIAKHVGVPKAAVAIRAGASGRDKLIKVTT